MSTEAEKKEMADLVIIILKHLKEAATTGKKIKIDLPDAEILIHPKVTK